jgi:hypothetical protein
MTYKQLTQEQRYQIYALKKSGTELSRDFLNAKGPHHERPFCQEYNFLYILYGISCTL